jgi:hypothetical protein
MGTARVCAEGQGVRFRKLCRCRPAENDLLIEARSGWHACVVCQVVSRADASPPQGRAFVTGQPSIRADLYKNSDFVLPPFRAAHGIVSTIDVVKGRRHVVWRAQDRQRSSARLRPA